MATNRQSAIASVPRTGQPFNPWRRICGFYPPDVISKLKTITDSKGEQRKLTNGLKRLYEWLVRRAGRDGVCVPSFESLASDLGRSLRQTKYDVPILESIGLIRHQRRGCRKGRRRLTNWYEFLWHPVFEEVTQTKVSADLSAESDDLSANSDRPKCNPLHGNSAQGILSVDPPREP